MSRILYLDQILHFPLSFFPIIGQSADNLLRYPSSAGVDPEAIAVAERMLEEIGCPRRPKYTASQLARHLGDDPRTWRRRFQLHEIEGFRSGRAWIASWSGLVRYVAQGQNVVPLN